MPSACDLAGTVDPQFPCSYVWRPAGCQPEHLISFPCDRSCRLTWVPSWGSQGCLQWEREQARCFSGLCLCCVRPLKQVMLLPRFKEGKRRTLPHAKKSCHITLQWDIQRGFAGIYDSYLQCIYLCWRVYFHNKFQMHTTIQTYPEVERIMH